MIVLRDDLKKILFVHKMPSGTFGDADSQYIPMTLAQLGFEVTLVALKGGDASVLRDAGVQVHELEGGKGWFNELADFSRTLRPDIVHAFLHAGCGLYPIIMRGSSRPGFVLDIRTPSLRTGVTRTVTQIKNRIEPLLYDAITAHSLESAWTLISKRHTVYYVPPGIELDRIPNQPRTTGGGDRLRLLYIGSLRSTRKIPEMINAVLLAGKSVPLALDIYGDGDDLNTIETLIRQNGAEEWIRLRSVIPRNELLQRFGLYDVGLSYVPKALFDPAPPLKTIEYLASGLTVVATDTKGNELLIEPQENGILAGEDAFSFAQGILLAANDPQLRRKFAKNARPSVEKYEWKHIVETQLLPVYEGIVQARPS